MSEAPVPGPRFIEQPEAPTEEQPLAVLKLIPQADLDDPDSISASMKVIRSNLSTRPMRYTASASAEIARLERIMRLASEHPNDEAMQQQAGSARLQYDEVKSQLREKFGDEVLGIYRSLLQQKANLASRREELLSPHD